MVALIRERVSVMMLTAHDHNGDLSDLTKWTHADRQAGHGLKARRHHGISFTCKHCHRGVHPVLLAGRNGRPDVMFFRHDPGEAAGCLLTEVARGGHSPEHTACQAALVGVHRRLGWDTEPEYRSDDGEVIVDIHTSHPDPKPHQWRRNIEVQLSPITEGDLAERTRQRSTSIPGALTQWLTPSTLALGTEWGLVVDPSATMVVDRIYRDPDAGQRIADPVPIDRVVAATVRDRPSMYFVQAGPPQHWSDSEATWIVAMTPATEARWKNGISRARAADRIVVARYVDRDECARDPVPVPERPARLLELNSNASGPTRLWCCRDWEEHLDLRARRRRRR